MIRRLVVLVLLVGGAVLLEPLRVPTEGVIAPRSLFLFGILLLTADTFGALAHDLRLPRLVGYLIGGLVLGPSAAGIVPPGVLQDLSMMKQLAVGLIALMAGAELRVSDLVTRRRTIFWVLALQTLLVAAVVTGITLLLQGWIPFLAQLSGAAVLAVTLLFATILTVNSPMATLALLTETRATGPVAKSCLSIVLVADVVIILLFSVVFSLARQALGHGAGAGSDALTELLSEVLGSVLAGIIVGAIVTLYLRFVKRELVLFAVVMVFATAGAAQALHFEVLLSLLVAGFLVENVAPVPAEPLVEALHLMAVPVFVIFFAMAGAELRIQEFATLLPVIGLVVLGRAVAIYGAGRLGGRIAGAEPVVVDQVWTGLVSQAGVALGFAAIIAERLPMVGAGLETLTVGVIAVNQTLGPILFRRGLDKAGEILAR